MQGGKGETPPTSGVDTTPVRKPLPEPPQSVFEDEEPRLHQATSAERLQTKPALQLGKRPPISRAAIDENQQPPSTPLEDGF